MNSLTAQKVPRLPGECPVGSVNVKKKKKKKPPSKKSMEIATPEGFPLMPPSIINIDRSIPLLSIKNKKNSLV